MRRFRDIDLDDDLTDEEIDRDIAETLIFLRCVFVFAIILLLLVWAFN